MKVVSLNYHGDTQWASDLRVQGSSGSSICPNTLELENKQLSSNHGNLESVFLSIQRVSEILDEVSWGKLLPTFFLRRKKKKRLQKHAEREPLLVWEQNDLFFDNLC